MLYSFRFILILFCKLCLGLRSGLFRVAGWKPACISDLSHVCCMHPSPTHLMLLELVTPVIFGEKCKPWKLLIMISLQTAVTSPLLGQKSDFQTPWVCVFPVMWWTKLHTRMKREIIKFVNVNLSVLDSKWEGKRFALNASRNFSDLIYLSFFVHVIVIC